MYAVELTARKFSGGRMCKIVLAGCMKLSVVNVLSSVVGPSIIVLTFIVHDATP
jgi:hypothetical protein